METISIVAGGISIILAIIAIWQAMYFYTKGKDIDGRVDSSLVGIKSQVDTLQAVNSKITDRLTRFVTMPRNESTQSIELLSMTLRSLPELALKFLPPNQTTNEAAVRKEITLAYVAIWYYAATTNVWSSFCLPPPGDFDPERHALVKRVVDQSAADFRYMDNLVKNLDQEAIQNRDFQYAHLYDEVTHYLFPLIGDTSEHFARMAKKT